MMQRVGGGAGRGGRSKEAKGCSAAPRQHTDSPHVARLKRMLHSQSIWMALRRAKKFLF